MALMKPGMKVVNSIPRSVCTCGSEKHLCVKDLRDSQQGIANRNGDAANRVLSNPWKNEFTCSGVQITVMERRCIVMDGKVSASRAQRSMWG